jgi:flagellar biosynthesis/type III secretory pathway M-ring protein FliF/YscJ
MLIVQTPISLFSLAYNDAAVRHGSRKSVVLAAVALAVLVGVLFGYWMAKGQYQFL